MSGLGHAGKLERLLHRDGRHAGREVAEEHAGDRRVPEVLLPPPLSPERRGAWGEGEGGGTEVDKNQYATKTKKYAGDRRVPDILLPPPLSSRPLPREERSVRGEGRVDHGRQLINRMRVKYLTGFPEFWGTARGDKRRRLKWSSTYKSDAGSI